MSKVNFNPKLLKAALAFVSASIFGPAGTVLGVFGEDLLGKIFGSSVDVISNILSNYSFEYLKDGFNNNSNNINKNKNHDIERMIFETLVKSVSKLEDDAKIIEYRNEIMKGIHNNISYDQEDLLKFEYFFEYWRNYSKAGTLSSEQLDRFFCNFNMNLYDIDVVENRQLEQTLQQMIFLDFDNLRHLHKLKPLVSELIVPVFKYEFLQAIKMDDKYKKARLALEYELSSEIKRIIQYVSEQQIILSENVTSLKENFALLMKANTVVSEKLDELKPYIREIHHDVKAIDHKIDMLLEYRDNRVYPTFQASDQASTNLYNLNQQIDLTEEEYNNIDENEILSDEIIHNSKRKIKGEVFAIELLTQPIHISYQKREGRYIVTIDRRGVENSIISTAAKTAICKKYIEEQKDKREELIKLDQEIHQFLMGNSNKEEFLIDLPSLGIPLRWASGGVLSVVNLLRNNTLEQWTPFFFRDINPSGWNIALGASERQFDHNGNCIKPIEYELNKPPLFVYREFLEEMLILEDTPTSGASAKFKKFYFDDDLALEQQKVANLFAREHIEKRNKEEGLRIVKDENKTGGFGNDIIKVNYGFDTKTDLIVIDKNGNEHFTGNVLITFNLLELGIEIIKVLTYSLDERNYILDGEILLRKSGDSELVRMPCALISHKALKRIFSKNNFIPQYSKGIQPSFSADCIKDGNSIKKNEYKMFDWDINQRYTRMTSANPNISHLEKERYLSSFQQFDYVFEYKKYLTGEIPTSFNPGTAKALSLYFARKEHQ